MQTKSSFYITVFGFTRLPPLDHIWAVNDCQEDMRKDYQDRSALYCLPQFCTIISSLI